MQSIIFMPRVVLYVSLRDHIPRLVSGLSPYWYLYLDPSRTGILTLGRR